MLHTRVAYMCLVLNECIIPSFCQDSIVQNSRSKIPRARNLDPENLDLSNLNPKNLDPKNLNPRNLDPKNLYPRNLDLRNLDPDNLNPRNLDPKKLHGLDQITGWQRCTWINRNQ